MPLSFKRLTSERSVSELSHCIGGCRPLDFCLYDRYEYESIKKVRPCPKAKKFRFLLVYFFSSAKPAGGLLVEQDQGSRPKSHAMSAKSRKNGRRLRPFEAVSRPHAGVNIVSERNREARAARR